MSLTCCSESRCEFDIVVVSDVVSLTCCSESRCAFHML